MDTPERSSSMERPWLLTITIAADLATSPRLMRLADDELNQAVDRSRFARLEQVRRRIIAQWGHRAGDPLFAEPKRRRAA